MRSRFSVLHKSSVTSVAFVFSTAAIDAAPLPPISFAPMTVITQMDNYILLPRSNVVRVVFAWSAAAIAGASLSFMPLSTRN